MIQQALIFDFSLGELSPKLRGRFDLPIYQHGASRLENAQPFTQGGFRSRAGTVYLGEAAAKVKLIPFIITPSLAYILELGHRDGEPTGFMNIWKDGARLEGPGYPLQTPYTGAMLPTVQYSQNENTLVFTHQGAKPYQLSFDSVDTFTFGEISFIGNAGEVPFQETGYYPGACQFHEGRLWLAASATYPGGIWASKPFAYNNFTFFEEVTTTMRQLKDPATWTDPYKPEYEEVSTTRKIVTAASAIELEIDDSIHWLASGRDLIVGAVRGERVIPAGSTPPLIPCQKNTAIGSAAIQPIMLAGAVMLIEADGQNVREYQYKEQENAYHAPALSHTADHILAPGVIELDYQNNPQPILWALRADGVLVGCVYEKAQGVTAWFKAMTTGEIESVAIIPEESQDAVYLAVNRGGARFIERMTLGARLDCTVSRSAMLNSAPVPYVDGTILTAIYNGAAYPGLEALGDSVALPAEIPDGAIVSIGLPFKVTVETMPIQAQTRIGTAHMRPKNPAQVIARTLNSYPFTTGTLATQLEAARFTGPFTGDVKIPIRAQWETEATVIVEKAEPEYIAVLALQIEVDAGG